MTISGMAAPGRSTGEAMDEMERLATALPEGFAYEWTGISFEEKQSGGQIGLLLALSFLVVFLLLSALYESWAIPISVLLVVPLGVLGSVLFTMIRGLSADVYFNVGRSEEHTSELQSLMRISYAVFCLKKKTIKTNI